MGSGREGKWVVWKVGEHSGSVRINLMMLSV